MNMLTAKYSVNFTTGDRTRKVIAPGPGPAPVPAPSPPKPEPEVEGNVPRVSRLMALAIRFEKMLKNNVVENYAELASAVDILPQRVTQIMNLRLLAPDIQEELLFLPNVTEGRAPITEVDMRPIAARPLWSEQHAMWRELRDSAGIGV
jgi:hypothetical protein